MSDARPPVRMDVLLSVVLAYGAASLLHHVHNAELLGEYPHMPAWISRRGVYAAWIGVTAVGLLGLLLLRRSRALAGLTVLAVYGLLGLGGLLHYALAPTSAHSSTMNMTIWLEVVTAVLLLVVVGRSMSGLKGGRR